MEIFRLRSRVMLIQGLLLKLYVASPSEVTHVDARANRREILRELDGYSQSADRVYLSDPDLAHLSDSERAMYAEEYREIVEQMKSFVKGLEIGGKKA